MVTATQNDDFDTPWKDVVERYLPDFIAFYFSDTHLKIDWSRGFTFLDQELAQIVQDAAHGKRVLDKLAKLYTLAGGEVWVLIHIEIQNAFEAAFSERLFVYNYRIFDKYAHPVSTMVILTDDNPAWRPDHYGYDLFGFKIDVHFPMVKLVDYAAQIEALLGNPNPFALVTAAHLLTRETKGKHQQRYSAKLRLAKLLYERNWDKQRVIDLFSVIDWMMQVPEHLEKQLLTEIGQFERNRAMPYVTSVERIGIEKGKLEGKLEGILEGELRGKLEGKQEEAANLFQRLMTRRFGAIQPEIIKRVAAAPCDQIEHWMDNIFDATSIDDVFNQTSKT